MNEMVDEPVLSKILSAGDLAKAAQTFSKLAQHDLAGWALTGGIATEIHILQRGRKPLLRNLNDIDFIAGSFDGIPKTLAKDFLFRHVHPTDPPGKMMMQLIDPASRLRVDIFRAFGETISRASSLTGLLAVSFRVISIEDLLARAARLALDVVRCVPTPSNTCATFCVSQSW
jgi:hypothetical protein